MPARCNGNPRYPFPGAGGSVLYNTMALSPDGSVLAVGSPVGYVAVIQPGRPVASVLGGD
jgi:hypothetical protein